MLSKLLNGTGVPIYIVSEKYGINIKSAIKIDQKDPAVEDKIFWRSGPVLGCEFSLISSISQPEIKPHGFRLSLKFPEYNFMFDVIDSSKPGFADEFYTLLTDLHKKAQNLQRLEKNHNTTQGTSQQNSAYQSQMAIKKAILDASLKEEHLLQMCYYLRYKEAYMLVERVVSRFRTSCKSAAFQQWVRVVKDENGQKMVKDRSRWRLHASANQDIDLQAWYHALFYMEVSHANGTHFPLEMD